MFWSVTWPDTPPDADTPHDPDLEAPRFVLHRHRDDQGLHLDLRLEQDGCLVGWRIPGDAPQDDAWATEKPPHPLDWLDRADDVLCLDRGVYRCRIAPDGARDIDLHGCHGLRRIRLAPLEAFPPQVLRGLQEALAALGVAPDAAPQLVRDGAAARQRAVERLCGLGRELDQDAFDEALWRRSLEGLALDEIHRQLRGYEVRFDLKYPPQPVSAPEPLPEDDPGTRAESVLTILRD